MNQKEIRATIRPWLDHAKHHGVYLVFETAAEEQMPPLALAHLAAELRKIQSTPKRDWVEGVPMLHGRQGRIPPDKGLRAPKGIIGEHGDALIAALLVERLPDAKIADLLGVKKDRIASVREALAGEEDLRSAAELAKIGGMKEVPSNGPAKTEAKEGANMAAKKSTKSATKKSSPAWKDLPKPEKAAYLLSHPTIPDHSWTKQKRKKGEKRDAFIRRVLGVKADA